MHFLDTNIIIRFLTGDDLQKQTACAAFFVQIERGEMSATTLDIVIAECVFVLSSPRLYHRSRQEVAELLTPLLQLSHFAISKRQMLLRALNIYADTDGLDFPDACIVAELEQAKATRLLSYDSDFDAFAFISREEPTPEKQAAS